MPAPTTTSRAVALQALRPDLDDPVARTAAWARAALDEGLLDLPLPARGATTERFAGLADLGTVDLDLARLAEAHVDAVAILADLAVAGPGDGLWGVWAANPPTDPLQARRDGDRWLLDGTKPWCSGAGCCDHALVTARTDDGYRLFAVDLAAPGATPVDGSWPAAAMQGSDSRSMRFDGTSRRCRSAARRTTCSDLASGTARSGVAAVWWGGARGVARALARADARRPLNPHALAHAGAVDAGLAAALGRRRLRRRPASTATRPTRRAPPGSPLPGSGAAVERAATEVVERTGRALGAAPLALDADHGRRVADLGLYLRQSHAERDLEELGRQSLDAGAFPWADPDGAP